MMAEVVLGLTVVDGVDDTGSWMKTAPAVLGATGLDDGGLEEEEEEGGTSEVGGGVAEVGVDAAWVLEGVVDGVLELVAGVPAMVAVPTATGAPV